MSNSNVLLLCFLQSIFCFAAKNESFDSLILSQHWPLTSCMDWKDTSPDNSCRIPGNATWSIRGLLISRAGKKTLTNCNSNVTFDISLLDPIKEELEKCWPDFLVGKSKKSVWEYQWEKHGSCAMGLMDSPVEYFASGCHLGKTHPIEKWLASGNLHPGNSYSLARIHEALQEGSSFTRIKEVLQVGSNFSRIHEDLHVGSSGFNTSLVVCQRIRGTHYLAEIKTCFSVNLTMISCDQVISFPRHSYYLGSCPRYGLIRYPNNEDFAMFESKVKSNGGQTFKGTHEQAMESLLQFIQHKRLEAKLARAKKLYEISLRKVQLPGRNFTMVIAPFKGNSGITFKGAHEQSMKSLYQFIQHKRLEAKLARAKKLYEISLSKVQLPGRNFTMLIAPLKGNSGKTFNGTHEQSMKSLHQVIQHKRLEAQLAREKKLHEIKLRKVQLPGRNFTTV